MSVKQIITIDIESTGTNPRRDQIHGVGVRFVTGDCQYFSPVKDRAAIQELLADPCTDKLGQNVTFDVKFLRNAGYEVKGRLWDTRKLAHLLDENQPTGLDALVTKYFGSGYLNKYGELQRVMQEVGAAHVGVLAALDLADPARPYSQIIGEYCLEDVKNTWELWQVLIKELCLKSEAMQRVFPGKKTLRDCFIEEDTPFLSSLVEIELPGIAVDMQAVTARQALLSVEREDTIRELRTAFADPVRELEVVLTEQALQKRLEKLKTEAGKERARKEFGAVEFDWNKASHISRLLFGALGVPTKGLRRTKAGISLDEEAILTAQNNCEDGHPARAFFSLYLKYKGLEKLRSTYIGTPGGRGLLSHLESGKVYPQYSCYLKTGRLSASEPNIQQLPRGSGIKKFFIPSKPGHVFVHADASQIELRIAAHLSQDEEMLRAYREGLDLHRLTAAGAFGIEEKEVTDEQRQAGKTTNFLLIFDGREKRLQAQLKTGARLDYSLDRCTDLINGFFGRYSQYREHLNRIKQQVHERRLVVSEAGRVRRLPDIDYGTWVKGPWGSRRWVGPKEKWRELMKLVEGPQCPEKVRHLESAEERAISLASLRYSHALKQAYNFVVQSLGATMTKRGIMALQKAGYNVICTIHDSVDIQLPANRVDELPTIKKILEQAYPLTLPVIWETKVLNSFDEKDVFTAINKAA